ncbi:MAG: aminotransferase class I/II-fold pyridoxal phosphate-dependent enzyme [Deltaproteobacteria bacterium]|nr:aminotransferase class I/II-fold pyridoxal phosphate-dependent enzyme [Deltaproteobacteria bacterium]
MKRTYDLSTRCVHAGEAKDAEGSPHTPIYNTTTFGFRSTADLLDVVEGRRPGNLYTRYGLNPTIRSVETKLASLENAETALVFASGMAAEAALFFAHGRKGIVCLGNAYGGTLALLTDHLPLLGIPTTLLLGDEVGKLEDVLKTGQGLVFFETPTNPTMEIFDVREISRLSHSYGALVAVDNTFASPINQQVLALGADIAVHSATKYLGGHSDLTGGALMGSKEVIEPVAPWRKNLGQMMAPEVAGLLSRSLRTLPIRVERQNKTAQAVAEAMRTHPKVARVLYPGLPDFPQHAPARAQMSGFGGMLTLEINGSGEDATKVIDALELIIMAPSLGGPESLATQPMTTTHHGLAPEERLKRGITDSMIRFSIGMEAASDLIDDMNSALGNI